MVNVVLPVFVIYFTLINVERPSISVINICRINVSVYLLLHILVNSVLK